MHLDDVTGWDVIALHPDYLARRDGIEQPRPSSPAPWIVEDARSYSARAHADLISALEDFRWVERNMLTLGVHASSELRRAEEDLDEATEALKSCWEFCEYGLTSDWSELDSGAWGESVEAKVAADAEPESTERLQPCKTETTCAPRTAAQGMLF